VTGPKASRDNKGWYSISVETLRGLGILAVLLVVVGIGFVAIQLYNRRGERLEAERLVAKAQGLIQQVQGHPEAIRQFKTEYDAAWTNFQEAQAALSEARWGAALDKAQRSHGLLSSILDALEIPGSQGGQARFVSVQGGVEFRRGDSGDWQEATIRVALRAGDYVRTSERGSAEISFAGGALYTVRPNTQFIVSGASAPGAEGQQAIEMEYGWVDLSTAQQSSNVKTPGALARVREDSEAFVSVDKESNRGRFGAVTGGIDLSSQGGLTQQVEALQEVVQSGDLFSPPQKLAQRPILVEPADNLAIDMGTDSRVVLAWQAVEGSTQYALQVSRNSLFIDNLIEDLRRTKTRATLGLRGEGAFVWRVAAYGREGDLGPWSKARRFRVSAAAVVSSGEKDSTPPQLEVEEVKSYGSIFMVVGRSEPGARVEVNGELVELGADGSFNKAVQVTQEGWSFIEVRARDGAGNATVRRQRVFVENP
jgi:hypothetical protein